MEKIDILKEDLGRSLRNTRDLMRKPCGLMFSTARSQMEPQNGAFFSMCRLFLLVMIDSNILNDNESNFEIAVCRSSISYWLLYLLQQYVKWASHNMKNGRLIWCLDLILVGPWVFEIRVITKQLLKLMWLATLKVVWIVRLKEGLPSCEVPPPAIPCEIPHLGPSHRNRLFRSGYQDGYLQSSTEHGLLPWSFDAPEDIVPTNLPVPVFLQT